MRLLIDGLNWIFEWIFFPFLLFGKTTGLLIFSGIMGIGLLALFKKVSNQRAIQRIKKQISAHILELRLYQDDLRLTFRAIGSIFYHNLLYLKWLLVPVLVFMLPVLLILVQLSKVYEYKPFEPNQSVMLSVSVSPAVSIQEVMLETPESVVQEIPPVRIPQDHRIYWRLNADRPGVWPLEIRYKDQTETVSLFVDGNPRRIAPSRMNSRMAALFHPVGATLDAHAFVHHIHIQYPSNTFSIFGIAIHWLVFFFIISVVTGFAFKSRLGVEL